MGLKWMQKCYSFQHTQAQNERPDHKREARVDQSMSDSIFIPLLTCSWNTEPFGHHSMCVRVMEREQETVEGKWKNAKERLQNSKKKWKKTGGKY